MWDRHRCHDNIISLLSKASSATPSSASCCVRLSHARQPTHLPLLFATVHLLAFQKCFYDLSQSIEYLNSGRGWGRISLPSSTACPARLSQLRVCRSTWPLVLTAAHDGWIWNMGCQSSDVMLLKQFPRFVILISLVDLLWNVFVYVTIRFDVKMCGCLRTLIELPWPYIQNLINYYIVPLHTGYIYLPQILK